MNKYKYSLIIAVLGMIFQWLVTHEIIAIYWFGYGIALLVIMSYEWQFEDLLK